MSLLKQEKAVDLVMCHIMPTFVYICVYSLSKILKKMLHLTIE